MAQAKLGAKQGGLPRPDLLPAGMGASSVQAKPASASPAKQRAESWPGAPRPGLLPGAGKRGKAGRGGPARGRTAQRALNGPVIVNQNYDANTHQQALLAANVQHVSGFFHANRDLILPKGLQSQLWSPYIEFNIANQYNLGARVVYDVEDRIVYLVGHYDDGGNYIQLQGVPDNVIDSLDTKVLAVLKNLCVGSPLESVANWTQVGSMGLLLRSLAGRYKATGSPI